MLGSGATVETRIMGRISEPPKHGESGCTLEILNIVGLSILDPNVWGDPHSDILGHLWLAVERVTLVLQSQLPVNLVLKISLTIVSRS